MANTKTTEGKTENSGFSDLTLGIGRAALLNRSLTHCVRDLCRLSGANFPNGSMRVCHGAGTTDEENNAGQQYYTDERFWAGNSRLDAPSIWGGGNGLWQATALLKMSPHYRRKIGHPIVEKEARLRPQHHFTFGSGATRMKMRKNPLAVGAGGFCAHPAPDLL